MIVKAIICITPELKIESLAMTQNDKIPLCDLVAQYQIYRPQMQQFFDEICMQSAFIKGKYCQQFEADFTKACEANYGAGCSNGTSALKLALEIYGVGHGDEVILPSHTFVATAEAILHVGATPVFADINPHDYTICPKSVARLITKKTKAIIAVHIYGTPCDMPQLQAICDAHNLLLFEDSAQAHLAKYQDKIVGNFGHAASFSFYPGKNLGAYGDAGFVIVRDKDKFTQLKRLIDHGRLSKHDHEINGYNERMDAMQAGILSIKLPHLQDWSAARRKIANHYHQAFDGKKDIKIMQISNDKTPVYHVYCIQVNHRAKLFEILDEKQISFGIHYPEPVHVLKPFQQFKRDNLNITEEISPKIASLPIYPEMTDSQIQRVIDAVLTYSRL